MSLSCSCPLAASLTAIPADDCPFEIGQVIKLYFQRVYSSGTTRNSMTIASSNPNALATWTALTGASDGTKVITTPKIYNPTATAEDIRSWGSDNEVPYGVPVTLGPGVTPFTASLRRIKPAIAAAMKQLMCENNLGVYLVNSAGKIFGEVNDLASPTIFYPIPILSFGFNDRSINGRSEPDSHSLSFSFESFWDDKLYEVTPTDFDPVLDL